MKRQFLVTIDDTHFGGFSPADVIQTIIINETIWTNVDVVELEPQERINEFNRKMTDIEEAREWDPISIH